MSVKALNPSWIIRIDGGETVSLQKTEDGRESERLLWDKEMTWS